jgi:hypothetical protein
MLSGWLRLPRSQPFGLPLLFGETFPDLEELPWPAGAGSAGWVTSRKLYHSWMPDDSSSVVYNAGARGLHQRTADVLFD